MKEFLKKNIAFLVKNQVSLKMVTDKGGVTMDLPIKIETKRLVLKGLNEPSFELAKNIYRVVDSTRDSLREWLPWVDKTHTPEDEYTHYLVEWCQKHWDNKEGFAYIIIDKETDGLIGCVDIFNISEKNKSAEIITKSNLLGGKLCKEFVNF